MKIQCLVIAMLVLSFPHSSWSAGKSPGWDTLHYRDSNGDGVNDLFRDANGDGINDISGKPYRHSFSFNDSDGDGINDMFCDANGDGINDFLDSDKTNEAGYIYFVIDFDDDGFNDVTGKHHQFGMTGGRFIDENGDGIQDKRASIGGERASENGQKRRMDTFKDEDADGINDGRGFSRELREKGKYRRRGEK